MTGRYWSRNLSWKWGSLGQVDGYSQLTRSRRGAEGTGSTRRPSGGSGWTGEGKGEEAGHCRVSPPARPWL